MKILNIIYKHQNKILSTSNYKNNKKYKNNKTQNKKYKKMNFLFQIMSLINIESNTYNS